MELLSFHNLIQKFSELANSFFSANPCPTSDLGLQTNDQSLKIVDNNNVVSILPSNEVHNRSLNDGTQVSVSCETESHCSPKTCSAGKWMGDWNDCDCAAANNKFISCFRC